MLVSFISVKNLIYPSKRFSWEYNSFLSMRFYFKFTRQHKMEVKLDRFITNQFISAWTTTFIPHYFIQWNGVTYTLVIAIHLCRGSLNFLVENSTYFPILPCVLRFPPFLPTIPSLLHLWSNLHQGWSSIERIKIKYILTNNTARL